MLDVLSEPRTAREAALLLGWDLDLAKSWVSALVQRRRAHVVGCRRYGRQWVSLYVRVDA